ncbi:MAG TPA: RNA polymerase sigma factor [Pyrinomonadaceae bacterium]|nr:RNA polymerase sigma factor [Pyrinomonadaceae bacterium]
MPEKTTDELLLERSANGDQVAFLELYERHRLPIFRFTYRLVGSVEVAEDVTHDCFLSLIRKPENFRPEHGASLRTYLFAAARNLAFKHFRNLGREGTYDDLDEEPVAPRRHEPLRRVLAQELVDRVREAITSLPPLQKEALVLFEYEGLTLSEIAVIADTDIGAVKSRLYRARERLKVILGPYISKGQQLNSSREIVTLKEA